MSAVDEDLCAAAAEVEAARSRVRQVEGVLAELAKPLRLSCDVHDALAALYSRHALQEAATKTLATMRARLDEAIAAHGALREYRAASDRYLRAERAYAAHTHPKMMRRPRFDADAARAAKRELDDARAAIDALAAKGEGE